jgi:hypothetical protein
MKKGRRIDAQCQAAGSQGHISGRLIDGFVLLLAESSHSRIRTETPI